MRDIVKMWYEAQAGLLRICASGGQPIYGGADILMM